MLTHSIVIEISKNIYFIGKDYLFALAKEIADVVWNSSQDTDNNNAQ